MKQILSGSLFTPAEGYEGPSPSTGPSFYPAPFPEAFYGTSSVLKHLNTNGGAVSPELLNTIQANAAKFWAEVQSQGWTSVRWFAYIFDEVDSVQDKGEAGGGSADQLVAKIHSAMRQVQEALDKGAGGPRRIHLVWTSQSDAAKWVGTAADLKPFISWWVPNGHALNVDFFKPIAAEPGQTVWFYHSGQPAIGNHTINQLGIDLRLWGLLCPRYGVEGSFWWSMMDFPKSYNEPDFNPYSNPSYKTNDPRWGNGVLFYPGSRLTKIGGLRNIQGPVASMRMKAYRRGLQDCEYCRLASGKGHGAEVDALLKKLIPAAFSEAPAKKVQGLWSQNPEDYYAMRRQLAQWIGPK